MVLIRKLDKQQRLCIPKDALKQAGFTETDDLVAVGVEPIDGKKCIVLSRYREDEEKC